MGQKGRKRNGRKVFIFVPRALIVPICLSTAHQDKRKIKLISRRWNDTNSLPRLCDAPRWLPLVAAVSSVRLKAFYIVLLPLPGIINWHSDIYRSCVPGSSLLWGFSTCCSLCQGHCSMFTLLVPNSHTNVSWSSFPSESHLQHVHQRPRDQWGIVLCAAHQSLLPIIVFVTPYCYDFSSRRLDSYLDCMQETLHKW